jgi:hypothetical protein
MSYQNLYWQYTFPIFVDGLSVSTIRECCHKPTWLVRSGLLNGDFGGGCDANSDADAGG